MKLGARGEIAGVRLLPNGGVGGITQRGCRTGLCALG